jgi:hypothetical protein
MRKMRGLGRFLCGNLRGSALFIWAGFCWIGEYWHSEAFVLWADAHIVLDLLDRRISRVVNRERSCAAGKISVQVITAPPELRFKRPFLFPMGGGK